MSPRQRRSQSSTQHKASEPKFKLRGLSVAMAVCFMLVIVFLGRWQVIDYQRFATMASGRLQNLERQASRGDILAADGSVLAYSEPRFDIYVYMDENSGLPATEKTGKQTRAEFVSKVSATLGISASDLTEKLGQKTKWLRIADKVSAEVRDQVLEIPSDKNAKVMLGGLDYEETSVRIYPEGSLASHVIGFLGHDDNGVAIGRSGLEQYFDGVLRPQQGVQSTETDGNQNVIAISDSFYREARRGASLITTIDKNIQAKVERLLQESVARFSARSGTVIIMRPHTGEIVALANYPTYDPNFYYEVKDAKNFSNLAITSPYEIGSVGKIFTMAAAVDQGKVLPNTVVSQPHKGCQEIIEGRVICTYDKKPQPALTATDAMIKSDNLALFQTAQLVGSTTLADYLNRFGMGKRTNIFLSGEDSGYIKEGGQWNEADLATYSYGHSYYQTTMQAITGVAAIANGGKMMEPIIVKAQVDNDGARRDYAPRELSQPIKESSVDTMNQIMRAVYLNNVKENQYADLRNYPIGMKSGTALIPFTALSTPEQKVGYSSEINATYVGYDASEQGSFVMLVNLSEPQTLPKLSYNNARLLWLDVFAATKADLGVPRI